MFGAVFLSPEKVISGHLGAVIPISRWQMFNPGVRRAKRAQKPAGRGRRRESGRGQQREEGEVRKGGKKVENISQSIDSCQKRSTGQGEVAGSWGGGAYPLISQIGREKMDIARDAFRNARMRKDCNRGMAQLRGMLRAIL